MRTFAKTGQIAGAIVLVVAAPLATLAFGGSASAVSSAPSTSGVVCTGIHGNYPPPPPEASLSGCSGGTSTIGTLYGLVSGTSVTWGDGNTTDFNVISLTLTPAGCPKKGGTYDVNGTVTGGTESATPVGQAVSYVICEAARTGKLTIPKGTTLNF